MNLSDEQLVIKYLENEDDESALEVLVGRYIDDIHRFITSYVHDYNDAEDITQEVFVRVWKNLIKFNPDKKFKSWIFTIAKNASLDYLKKNRVIPFTQFNKGENANPVEESFIDQLASPLKLAEYSEVKQAVGRLSRHEQKLAELRYYKQNTYREIAQKLKMPLNTAKSQCRRVLGKLRGILR